MKRLFCAFSAFLLFISAGSALAYTKNDEGLYVDSDGQVIEDYWDDAAGLYIVDGVGYSITDADSEDDSDSDYVPVQNADGSMTVESGQIQIEDPSDYTEGAGHLTQAEWSARWAKYTAANGKTTGTIYQDEDGNFFAAEILFLGLGRSTIRFNGQEKIVPTSSLRWDTEAPDDQVLAVSTPDTQTYLTLRAKKSKKAFVMGHCDKCKVLRVINVGKTWTMVDDNGVRGYVITSGLTFFDNAPKSYAAGMITVKGKTPRGNFVHVRSAASNKSRQIAEYPVGTAITVFSQDEKWSEVDVAGLHCYILNEFVTLLEDFPPPEPAPEEEPVPGLAPMPEEESASDSDPTAEEEPTPEAERTPGLALMPEEESPADSDSASEEEPTPEAELTPGLAPMPEETDAPESESPPEETPRPEDEPIPDPGLAPWVEESA